jgi:CDP-4-dehydro-6-deoxyglucose reductase, E1
MFKIPLMKNAFVNEKETKDALVEFIQNTTQLSMGKMCQQFETEFAIKQRRKYAVLFNSGASANLALLQALKNLGRIKTGDRCGFSALTWATNVFPIMNVGMEPVPIDVSIKTLNVMSEDLEQSIIKQNLSCFFATNVLGFAGDLDKIKQVCEKHNVLFIEDSCEANGTVLNNNLTGNFGLASTFSYFVAHQLSCIEGGMVCTDDEDLWIMLSMCRANGWDRNLPSDIQQRLRIQHGVESDFKSKYTFYDLGFNLRPTEITGIIGVIQLKYLSNSLQIRHNNYIEIDQIIKNNPDLVSVDYSHLDFIPAFSTPIIAKTKTLRDVYYDKFKDTVEIRPIICGNITKCQPFWKKYINKNYELPNADFIDNNGFYFTNDSELTRQQIDLLKQLLQE